MDTVLHRYRELLKPYLGFCSRHLIGVVIRQALLVAGGYGLVWVLRHAMGQSYVPFWILGVFLIYDAGLLRLDLTLNRGFATRVSYPMFHYLRSTALSKFFSMPLEWHLRNHSGMLAGKVNNGVGKVVQTAELLSRDLGPALIRTGLSLIPLLFFSIQITPIVAAAFVAFAWLTVNENRRRERFRRARHENYAQDFAVFSECLEYVHPVVMFGQSERVLDQYHSLQADIEALGIEEMEIAGRFGWWRNLVLAAGKRTCQAIWLWQFSKGALDAALVMYLSALLEELLNSVWGYAGLIERIYDGLEPARDLVTLIDEPGNLASILGFPVRPVEGAVEIEMRNVDFAYRPGEPVLCNFNLRIAPGTVLGLVGRSGMGKTTITHLLSRTHEPHNGSILVAGRDVRDWPLDQLRALFAYMPQNGGVFFSGATIRETVSFGQPDATFEEVVAAAKCACIHSEILSLPNQYETRLGQRGLTLSAGQRQRIALAQALLALRGERKVLILDEFTSALDARTEQQILTNLAPVLRNQTSIIIAHRLATLRKVADQIMVLDQGSIVEMGAHAELVKQNGIYAELANLQATA